MQLFPITAFVPFDAVFVLSVILFDFSFWQHCVDVFWLAHCTFSVLNALGVHHIGNLWLALQSHVASFQDLFTSSHSSCASISG
jgi:hypothetical protein